jgi:hypothetical protein
MDEYDAQIKSENEILTPTALGTLGEERIQHEGSTTTKDHPRPLMRKGRLI